MYINAVNNPLIIANNNSSASQKAAGESFHKLLASAEKDSGYDHLFKKAEAKWGIPAGLLKAVGKAESNFNPRAVSKAGAQGIMQLMPATGRSLGVKNPFDPEENINGAAKYLSSLLERYQGDVRLSLAAYNAGPGNVAKYKGVPPFKETQRYLEKILGANHQEEAGKMILNLKPEAKVENRINIPGDTAVPSVEAADARESAEAIYDFSELEISSLAYLKYLSQLNFIRTVLGDGEEETDW